MRRGGLKEGEGRTEGRDGGREEREEIDRRGGEWLLLEYIIHLREHLCFKRP